MKKTWIILSFLAAALWACNNNGEVQTKSATTENVPHEDHANGTTLQLNHGAKWNSDESTNKNVAELDAITLRFNDLNPTSLEAFQSVGDTLKAGLDVLIKQCRMKGPDHDALHLWLEPLLTDVHQLQKASDSSAAADLYKKINSRIKDYQNYFE